jgi:DNA-binding transcriptional MerR regulator
MRTLLQIGEIAQLLGVTPKTIRHYEKMGRLAQPERTRAGYRLYDAQDLLRLQRIRRLQALGLSLKKIRALLGEPEHQHTLWDVLQSLDKELAAQIQALEERRNKIRALLDEDTLATLDHLSADSPTFQFVQERLAQHRPHINPTLWEQEAQAYALLDGFKWSRDQPGVMMNLAQHLVGYITEHPEEYQQLLALGERLVALTSLPEDAPEVQQLVEDFVHYFEKYPFLPDLRKRVPQLENPFPQLLEELMMPLYSPGQIKVLNELARRISKEGNM